MSSREHFHAWYREHIYPLASFDMDWNGGYISRDVQIAWRGWEASRQELVIKLPESFPLGDGHGRGLDPEDTREAIEAAGVRVSV